MEVVRKINGVSCKNELLLEVCSRDEDKLKVEHAIYITTAMMTSVVGTLASAAT